MLSSVHSWTPLGLHAVCSQKWNLCPASRISCSETCRICTAAYSLCANFNKKILEETHLSNPLQAPTCCWRRESNLTWPWTLSAFLHRSCQAGNWGGGKKKKNAASIGGRSSGSSLICQKAQIPNTSPANWIQVGSSTSRHPKSVWGRLRQKWVWKGALGTFYVQLHWTINLKNNFTEFILFNVKMGKFHLSYCPFRLFQIWRNFPVLRFFLT